MADALKQQAQKQQEIAENLANLTPQTKDPAKQAEAQAQQEQAVEDLAKAMTDLQKQNVANTDATQARAEQL